MKMNRAKILIAVLLTLSGPLTACSSFLYYPTRVRYMDPQKIPIHPDERVFFESPDKKEKLMGWYFKSPHKTKALLLIFHGNAQNVSSHFFTMYWALEKGYDIFIFDYPGYGGSFGEPTPRNTLEAGHHALDYARKTWPELPVAIIGQSLGGAIALRTVIDRTDRQGICAFVADSTFLSYTQVAQKALAKTWFTWLFQPLAYIVLSDKYAPKDRVAEISPLPLLVIYRKEDPIVPSSMGEDVFAKAKQPKSLLLLQGSGHVNAFTDSDRVENQRALLDFLKVCG